MSNILEKSVLEKISQHNGICLYRLSSPFFLNSYRVLSSAGTRKLMASPEVVGYESYASMVPSTTYALSYLRENEQLDEANILTILRGGLNYPIEECCHAVGIRVGNINFVSCERIIENGIITGLDIKYEKLHVTKNSTLIIGDIVASGDTLQMCLREIVDRFRRKGGSIRRIFFFTVGGTRAISLMESLTVSIRDIWPEFEGFDCFFYEGIFSVYTDTGVAGVNIPMIDFGWNGGVVSPEFRREIVSNPDALFEKCIIYDGGARRYEIPAHIDEVLEYWNDLAAVAPKVDFKAFLQEKIGYEAHLDYESWLGVTHLEDCNESRELYDSEKEFIARSLERSLPEICKTRLEDFTCAMKDYIN